MLKLVLISMITLSTLGNSAVINPELDAYWAELSRTVEEGDFEGYGALYHDDAVLVNGISEDAYSIMVALEGWKQGFDDTKAGLMQAEVTFRFSKRIINENTAFEAGIFRYVATPQNGEPQIALVHFESLLIRKNGEWLMMMENQKSVASEEEWEALK